MLTPAWVTWRTTSKTSKPEKNLKNLGRGKINEILRELHGAELNGNKLRVQLSTSGGGGGGGGDGGFK